MYNSVTLIGRVGKDVEFFDRGAGVAKFTVATSERRKSGSEYVESTEWHRIVAFGNTATFARDWIRKGQLLTIVGKIHYDSYENKEGQKVYTTEIYADRVMSMEKAVDSQKEEQPRRKPRYPEQPKKPNIETNLEEDLPF